MHKLVKSMMRNGSIPWNHPRTYAIHHQREAPRSQEGSQEAFEGRLVDPQSRPPPRVRPGHHREMEPSEDLRHGPVPPEEKPAGSSGGSGRSRDREAP